jgi:uncharacterized repeat protein (TIGR03803 family)
MGIGHAPRNWFLARIFVLGAGALIAASFAARVAAADQEEVLYSFCSQHKNGLCTDGVQLGSAPGADLIMDASGDLYGTTYLGGASGNCPNGPGCGVAFELTPNATKTAWTEKVLYSFCVEGARNDCPDGQGPLAGLIMDAAGHLYGTTGKGGAHAGGTVFELTPNATKTAWTEKVLYSFCSQKKNDLCTDGVAPEAGLIMDASGNVYGTTTGGGEHGSFGTVFELTPDTTRTAWTQKVLYSFCVGGQGGNSCSDGANPFAGLIMDQSGDLYGTTFGGGANNGEGTVFELTPNPAETAWVHKVLYSFCAFGGASCTDGANPRAGLIADVAGNLYGTTVGGGAHSGETVFELTPNPARTVWTEKVLYSFCARGGASCTDGTAPIAGLIRDASGNLYGTTRNGGAYAAHGLSPGTVFELTPNAAKIAWTEKVLYSFCAQNLCTDGTTPIAGLIRDVSGNLFGTTAGGGAHDSGTVFELEP